MGSFSGDIKLGAVNLRRKILQVQLGLLLGITAFIGILLNIMIQTMTPDQWKQMYICYGWEILVFWITLLLPYIWAKPLEEFVLTVKQGKKVEEAELLRIQRLIFNYPLKVMLLLGSVSFFAYFLGGIQLVYFTHLNLIGFINEVLIGVLVSVTFALFCFFFSEKALQPVGELLSSMTLNRGGVRKIGLSTKITSICLVFGLIPLIGVSTVIMNKAMVALEYQVKERGLERLNAAVKWVDIERGKKKIEEQTREAVFGEDGYVFFIDDTGKLLFHSQREEGLDATIEDERFQPELVEAIYHKKRGTYTDLIEGRLVAYAPAKDGNLMLVSVFSMKGQYGEIKRIAFSILVVAVVVLLMVLLLSVVFSGNIKTLAEKMVSILDGMAVGKGDLTQRIRVNSNDELGELSNRFDTFLNRFYEIVERVVQVTNQVAVSAEESSKASEEIARGVDAQSSQTIEISTSIEEMSATVREVAKNATDVADNARTAMEIAKKSGDIVNKTVEGMVGISATMQRLASGISALGQRADEIGEIIEVVDDIADQTNLLALNAAIEAARAGEHGRGFSVVADEVRKLAERTTAATKEVASAIKAIQNRTNDSVISMGVANKEVEMGVDLANQSGEALNKIIEDTGKISEMVAQIASATEEQSSATDQISVNVEGITSIIGKTATSITESAGASLELAKMAEGLQMLVGQFKLRDSIG